MKKTCTRILTLFLLIAVIGSCICFPAGATEKSKSNRYNVVFVTDASGSMQNTDPDGYRFESINLFVSLLANGANKVGSVVFGDGIASKHEMVEVKGKTEKTSIFNQVSGQKADGWTDIGSGLMTAVEMLKNDGDESLPSIIILLTDGNTEMATPEETQISTEKKEDALEEARANGIQIYSICLNKDNTANGNELKQIATATGGQFQEVTSAADLQAVFDLYYQLIYSTQSVKLVDETVPASGTITREFDVADLGVEEVNIVIFGDVKNCSMKKPGGAAVSAAQLDEMLYRSKTFTLVKIADPEKGVWGISVNAEPNSKIKIFKIYNSNLQVDASIVAPKDAYVVNEKVDFLAKIKENDTVVTDLSRYAGYKAVLHVKDYDGKDVHTQEAASADADGFALSFTPADYGTYYATVSIETDNLYSESEPFTLNVGNTPPVATADVIKKHINRWPFLIKTDSTIDLSQTATDAEDKTLKYAIKSSTWMEEDYTLDNDKLTIDHFSVSNGSFTVEAYDSMGAFCTYEIKVTSTNIGLWAVILILGGILLFLLIAGILTYKSLLIAFMGELNVENIATGETGVMEPGRGRLRLLSMQVGHTGLHKGCYFQATGKSYIYFVSPKPVYAENSAKKTKKVRLDSSMNVRISTSPDYDSGINVRFESIVAQSMY